MEFPEDDNYLKYSTVCSNLVEHYWHIYRMIMFFLSQQFITQSTKADCGSYFIATYIGLIIWKTHKKRLEWNRKEEKKEKESVKTIQCPLEKQKPLGWSWDSSIYCVSYSCEVCEVLILWSSHCMGTQMILWGKSKGSILLWEHGS